MTNSEDKMKVIERIAFDYFLDKGYDATTVRMICKKARIEPPTLYYYFGSKKGLFLSIVNSLLEDYTPIKMEHIKDNHNKAEGMLYRIYEYSVNYTLDNYQVTKFYLRYILFTPKELQGEIKNYVMETLDRRKQLYYICLSDCINQGKLNCDLDTALIKLVNFVDSAIYNVIFSNWRPSTEELYENFVIFYKYSLKGL
jgi:AcrR family transcriptional regulator